ncbi:thiamine pyrophosphate-dependent enzyme [Methanosphaerula subterraneus]|uniref:thiamine pyrophosphate-dependent enzyme n=1 Tax=Methanosphaerula subterraneus TaxID=3350244 RepID=UPI003F84326F
MVDKTCELFDCGHRACGGCGAALAGRLLMKGAGENTIVVASTGCMEVFSTPYPETAWKVPWIHSLFENASAVASGIEASLKRQGRTEKVVVVAGDGATLDIGVLCISGAFERGHDFTYICYDNEAYMNTGIQRSGATPFDASTTTSPAGKCSFGNISSNTVTLLVTGGTIIGAFDACIFAPGTRHGALDVDAIRRIDNGESTANEAFLSAGVGCTMPEEQQVRTVAMFAAMECAAMLLLNRSAKVVLAGSLAPKVAPEVAELLQKQPVVYDEWAAAEGLAMIARDVFQGKKEILGLAVDL